MISGTIVEDAQGNRGEVLTSYISKPGEVLVRWYGGSVVYEKASDLTEVG